MSGFSNFFFFGYSNTSVICLKPITFSKEYSNLTIFEISTYFLEVSMCFHSIKAFFFSDYFWGNWGLEGSGLKFPNQKVNKTLLK